MLFSIGEAAKGRLWELLERVLLSELGQEASSSRTRPPQVWHGVDLRPSEEAVLIAV